MSRTSVYIDAANIIFSACDPACTRVSYLVELGALFTKEKPPAGT